MGNRRENKDESETVEQGRPRPGSELGFRLEVVAGPDRGATFAVETRSGPTLLGQASVCAIRVTDPSVSRRHLELEALDGVLRVRDLESTNGTLVNATVMLEARLRGGETLQVGDTVLRVVRGPERPLEATRLRLGRLIGGSDAMQPLYRAFEATLHERGCVLIEGERGSGKALLSQMLHEQGPNARGPFVVVRASELRELRDDAVGSAEDGAFAAARGGTLVLEEVTELAPDVQTALATRLSELSGVAGPAKALTGHSDVRIVSTATQNLDRAVEEGRFDASLADRLSTVRLALPALRARRGDVEMLAAHFWNSFGGVAKPMPALQLVRLASLAWPGNVTELQREVARLVARTLGDGETSRSMDDPRDFELPFSRARQRILDRFERLYVEKKLESCGGNVSRAAEEAGVARRYFQIVKSRHHL